MSDAPRATYRVQLHSEFGFAALAAIAPYLAELGVSHVYCSPYLQAVPGSTHGYDVVDPTRISDDLGGAGAHAAMTAALRDAGLRQMLDIVPNHMAADPHNRWWWDVLENGPASRFAHFFDIEWAGPDDRSPYRVLVPVLGDHYGRVLEAGELHVERDDGAFVVRYHDHVVPVSPRTLDEVLGAAARRAGCAPLGELAVEFGALPSARLVDRASVMERHDRKLALEAELRDLCGADATVASAIDAELASLDGDADRLDALIDRQNYRLAFWRTAHEEIDYRRFFNIDTLVGVRVEDTDVFDTTHRLILDLVADGTVSGLRVDHVDGLRDPAAYLDALAAGSHGVYTVVEKILEPGEVLPAWPVGGTSGYDFLNRVNGLFVAREHERVMTECYESFTGETRSYDDVVHDAKLEVMRVELAPEAERVTGLLAEVCDGERRQRDHTRGTLRDAVHEFVAAFAVYRSYVEPGRAADNHARTHIDHAVAALRARRPDIDGELVELLGTLALGEHESPAAAELTQRLQQLTAPVMAKGVEDTAFYRYYRLASLNEVGGDPGQFGRDVAGFHRDTCATAAAWPDAMLTLSTHDTKRSADVRARIHVLSEIPHAWHDAVERWANINERHRTGDWPDRNTEYLLYQTLVGAWPIDAERLTAFMAKAVKEAKVHTSWTDPSDDYDGALDTFARGVLGDTAFVADFERFLAEHDVVARGRANSLAQTALLLTCPGVPDLYQGSELWDLSLVDPDNRRRVDYDARRRVLAETSSGGIDAALRGDDRGAAKLRMIRALLAWRADGAFDPSAGYEPVCVEATTSHDGDGDGDGDDAVAFARADTVVVARCRTAPTPTDAAVALPQGRWRDVLSGAHHDGGRRRLTELCGDVSVAVLARDGD